MYYASDDSLWGSLESEVDGSLSFIAEDVAPGDYYIFQQILMIIIFFVNMESCVNFILDFLIQLLILQFPTQILSGYEIYLKPRYRYGGPNAASLSNNFNTTSKN